MNLPTTSDVCSEENQSHQDLSENMLAETDENNQPQPQFTSDNPKSTGTAQKLPQLLAYSTPKKDPLSSFTKFNSKYNNRYFCKTQ
ncbi:unnamed protein product [Ceutorhynchus assimilis]|uniref:Uncharacterized protein n=1 Tax=Ceutorhynchus assimilis TaxID=467358 RepID=A0A9N9MI77_9CUCU|nr:unnamed protein product [Ceutorhynchus assimilis]